MVINMLTRERIDRPQATPGDEPPEERVLLMLGPRLDELRIDPDIRARAEQHAINRVRCGDTPWLAARSGEACAQYEQSRRDQSQEPQPPSAA